VYVSNRIVNLLASAMLVGTSVGWGTPDQRARKLSSIAEHYIWDRPEVQALCADFVPQEGATDMLGREDHLLTRYPLEDLPRRSG